MYNKFWDRWYGLVTIIAIMFTVLIGLVRLLAYASSEDCTPGREGAIYYHGESGGMDYVCHDNAWRVIKRKGE